MGVALRYDVGFRRQCWHIHRLAHWMGDHGWIRGPTRSGEEVMPGGAVNALPRRGDASPAERRLRWSAVRGSEP